MPDPPPLVDVHCHLLPGMDDGASSWDESLAMARLAACDGISTVVATPHQLGGTQRISGRMIRRGVGELRELVDRHSIPLRVVPGAEIRVEPDLVAGLRQGDLLTLADRGRHVLLELPHDVYLPLDRVISDLAGLEIVPILAHPERNPGILAQRDVLQPLVAAGCLLQVTAGSLLGAFGPQVQKFSRWLIGRQWVYFVGSDAHGAKSRRPLLRRAFDCVSRLAGQEAAVDLCCRNPALVVAGEDLRRVPPVRRESRLAAWLPWKRAG